MKFFLYSIYCLTQIIKIDIIHFNFVDILHYFDFVFAYQESIDSKLITSKHRLINYLIDKEYKILYIEVPDFFPIWIFKKFRNLIFFNRKKYINEKIKKVKIIKPFTFIPTKFLFDNKVIAKFEAFTIKTYLKFILKNKVIYSKYFFVYVPKAIELIFGKFILSKNIYYHLIDDFRFLKRAPKIINYYHKLTLSLSSKIFTPSYFMAETINNEKVHILPHGYINYKFNKNNYDIKNLISQNYKNIIYYGQLNKLNYSFIDLVISELKEFNFIFIGNIYCANIRNYRNVNTINFLDHKKLMFVLKSSQLLWCPFLQNKLNFSMTPIKFVEALSFGIPVLSTNINLKDPEIKNFIEFRDYPVEHIDFIRSFQAYESTYKKIERKNAVRNRNWENIINKLHKEITTDV